MIDIDKLGSRQKRGRILISASGVLTPIIASISDLAGRIDAEKHAIIYSVFDAIKSNLLILALLLLFLFLVGNFLARSGQKVIWLTLQSQIDSLASIAFPNADGDLNDRHRVTIFKYQKWCWTRFRQRQILNILKLGMRPNSGWLVPILRSGHTGKNTQTVFLAPDIGSSAEGVAGLCWSCDSGVFKTKLPSVTAITSEQNKDKYARLTGMPRWMIDTYVNENRPMARCLFAFPVRDRIGKRWGVIVLDSQDSGGIDRGVADSSLRTIIEPVGVLLEEI